MRAILFVLIFSLATPIATSGALAAEPDPILRAMGDELSRSVNDLKIEKRDKPYYISYMISDEGQLNIAATFGALTKNEFAHTRHSFVDVHVGNYQLDSGHCRKGLFLLGGEPSSNAEITVDDDYDAIRHELWLQTDSAYKNAVQNLDMKKSELDEKTVKERPDDWSKEAALVRVESKQKLAFEREAWAEKIKKWSALFKEYPQIKTSKVALEVELWNKYFINSEGSKIRVPDGRCMLTVNAVAQGSDGFELFDSVVFGAFDLNHMPTDASVQEKIDKLAANLTRVVTAKELETYDGPILLESPAAAEFIDKVLVPTIVVKRPFDGDPLRNTEDPSQSRLGRRILPTYVSVEDDPTLRDGGGGLLPDGYEIDNEGVSAQKVTVVEKGILKKLLSTRLPTLKSKNSNGHAPGSGGDAMATNLIVKSDRCLDPQAMRAKLIALGKDEGLDYVLVVRKFASAARLSGIYMEDVMAFLSTSRTRSGLPFAVEVVKVYLSDGHEELLRGGQFTTSNLRMLRDIAATGDDVARYQLADGKTVTTPSVLLADVEIQKIHADADKPPKLAHPFFEKH